MFSYLQIILNWSNEDFEEGDFSLSSNMAQNDQRMKIYSYTKILTFGSV